MEKPSMILHLVVVAFTVHVVTCQDVASQNKTTATNSSVAIEGGSISMSSSEKPPPPHKHLISVNHPETKPPMGHMLTVNKTSTQPTAVEFPPFEVGQKNDNKTSVPKKDAIENTPLNTNKTVNSTSSTTTTTQIPQKPTLTEGEDDLPASSDSRKNTPAVGIDNVNRKTKRTDYVVPIVAVILSVPIVAIVFSVLYKRGSDWWQHRHYRRMDFLIEGMYNN